MTRVPVAIAAARDAHEATGVALKAAIQQHYPIDSRWFVMLGKTRILGRVTGYSAEDPTRVLLLNERTRAFRYFDATWEGHHPAPAPDAPE